uniref:TetR/AcrR family transcriptional regulator n=1 Tax=Ornithinibacillus scapharcae TaxID=1147159 RepID=UPI000225ADC7
MNKRENGIVSAAQKLFIEKGYHATSIQDIIDHAGVSKGTFYNYFASKVDCLLAILESVHTIGEQKRLELALSKDKHDEEVFIQQIIVRSKMNQEHDMLILFDMIMHLDEPKIKEFLDKQYQYELQWISRRLCEIYTPAIREQSVDYAVMLLGSIHHFMHVWKLTTVEEIDLEKVIRFILKRMKPMIHEQIQTGEKFFSIDWFEMEKDTIDPEQLLASIVE